MTNLVFIGNFFSEPQPVGEMAQKEKKYLIAKREENELGNIVPGRKLGRFSNKKIANRALPALLNHHRISPGDRYQYSVFLDGQLVQ